MQQHTAHSGTNHTSVKHYMQQLSLSIYGAMAKRGSGKQNAVAPWSQILPSFPKCWQKGKRGT